MDGSTLLALAEATDAIALSPERAEEIAAELTATLATAATLTGSLLFEDEPAAFVAALEALAPAEDAA